MGIFALILAALVGIGAIAQSSTPAQAAEPKPAQTVAVSEPSAAPAATFQPLPPVQATTLVAPAPAPAAEQNPAVVVIRAPGQARAFDQLKTGTVLELPDSIKTVEQAANYVLTPTGYSLMVPNDGFRSAAAILLRPTSAQSRVAGYTTIENALLIIAGDDVRLVIDHANKLVSFEPNT